ncbi:MAG: FHA domain-containing protein [Deltaproteobacteria bacterium]|nr:FHA domain-containing protein [Deltaproteobacteria bacterium]
MKPEDKGDWVENTLTSESDVKADPTADTKTLAVSSQSMLEQKEGPGSPRKIPLSSKLTVFGRSTNCTVQLHSSEISRAHMMIKKEEGRFICQDLESYNGVHLNGIRIHSAELRNGDTIQIGNVVFIFRLHG